MKLCCEQTADFSQLMAAQPSLVGPESPILQRERDSAINPTGTNWSKSKDKQRSS